MYQLYAIFFNYCLVLAFTLLLPAAYAQPKADESNCRMSILETKSAKARSTRAQSARAHPNKPYSAKPWQQPLANWQSVSLPDNWDTRWQGYTGGVWYQVTWQVSCIDSASHSNNASHSMSQNAINQKNSPKQNTTLHDSELMAVYIDYMSMAGAVYLNGELLWRDTRLQEPLSRSWNQPRYWTLPVSLLNIAHISMTNPDGESSINNTSKNGLNTLWVYVAGVSTQSPGLGTVKFGQFNDIKAHHEQQILHKRTLFFVNVVMSGLLGLMFFIIWLLYRKVTIYGWFACTQIFWSLFISNLVITETVLFADSMQVAKANLSFFVIFIYVFLVFVWQFSQTQYSKLQPVMNMLTVMSLFLIWLSPDTWHVAVFLSIFLGHIIIFLMNCLVFQYLAWHSKNVEMRLMGICLVIFCIISVHDTVIYFDILSVKDHQILLTPYAILVITVFIALILALRFRLNWERIQSFNDELQSTLAVSQKDLKDNMESQHKLALENAHLQARLQLSHDLHDGLGGSLVRAITTIDSSTEKLSNQQFVSVLKLLRNDLRQVIDSGSSLGANAPDTPIFWAAPVRHRFSQLFDELGIECTWQIPKEWCNKPSTLKCLTLLRVLEESLTNVMKHSQASHVTVTLTFPRVDNLLLEITDDGVGFSVEAVQQSGLSVGMRSMQVRLVRVGGQLDITSEPGKTYVRAEMVIDS